MATVVLVITPISWILLHEPQAERADASVPYVTRDDDTYITASNEPVVATPTAPASTTPTPVPSTSTPTPAASATPGQTPSTAPTDGPTATPTNSPSSTTGPTAAPRTTTAEEPNPSQPPSSTPPSATPPPPADNGSMSGSEAELFALVDNARTTKGCAPLRRNSNLTGGARTEAEDRAASGQVSATGSSKAAAGGKDMTAKTAFDRLMSQSSATVLNCGLDELGVGRGTAQYCSSSLLGLCLRMANRVSWVADFK